MSIGAAVRVGAAAACVFSVLAPAVLVGSAEGAEARPKVTENAVKAAKSAPTAYSSSKSMTQAVDEPSATMSTGTDPGCSQSRKRLWVEGEGWIVRRVTTCF